MGTFSPRLEKRAVEPMSHPVLPDLPRTFRDDLRRAVRLFIENAYGDRPPASALRYIPPEGDFDIAGWLMSDLTERVPGGAPFEAVQAFSLRIGCRTYRHMKLKISRPGSLPSFVFLADSHDSFLVAEPGSPDWEGLQALKRGNAEVASRITEAWDREGILTERSFLREKIRQAREKR
jgi:hypothetical protein